MRRPVRFIAAANHGPMKPNKKKLWIKPSVKDVPIFFECTCYAGAV